MLAFAGARSIDLVLSSDDVARALKTGKGTEAERARFHSAYLVPLQAVDPALERMEVLTEFRRAVLDAEDHLRLGDHMFSVRQATEALRPWRGKLTLSLHLRFHPHNVLVSVPAYVMLFAEPGPTPLAVRRTPLFTLAPDAQKPGAPTSLYGGIVEVDFDAAKAGQTSRVVQVLLDGKELAHTTINLARLE